MSLPPSLTGRMTSGVAAGAVMVLGLSLTACDTTPPRTPTTVVVEPATLTMERGDTVAVQATVLDQEGQAFTTLPEGLQVEWRSEPAGLVVVLDDVPGETEVLAAALGSGVLRAEVEGLDPATVQVSVPAEFSGSLSATYAGDRSGSFAISSTYPLDAQVGLPVAPEWVFSEYEVEFDDQDVLAFRQVSDERFDFLWFWTDGRTQAPGSVSAAGAAFYGIRFDDTDDMEAAYDLQGSVNYQAVSPYRLRGTFSFEGSEFDTGAALTITGGEFSTPVLEPGDFQASGAAGVAADAVRERLREVRDRLMARPPR